MISLKSNSPPVLAFFANTYAALFSTYWRRMVRPATNKILVSGVPGQNANLALWRSHPIFFRTTPTRAKVNVHFDFI